MVLIIGTPKKVPLILGNPHISLYSPITPGLFTHRKSVELRLGHRGFTAVGACNAYGQTALNLLDAFFFGGSRVRVLKLSMLKLSR